MSVARKNLRPEISGTSGSFGGSITLMRSGAFRIARLCVPVLDEKRRSKRSARSCATARNGNQYGVYRLTDEPLVVLFRALEQHMHLIWPRLLLPCRRLANQLGLQGQALQVSPTWPFTKR